jgi:hypothetical protein
MGRKYDGDEGIEVLKGQRKGERNNCLSIVNGCLHWFYHRKAIIVVLEFCFTVLQNGLLAGKSSTSPWTQKVASSDSAREELG